jgi:hypothetical protein
LRQIDNKYRDCASFAGPASGGQKPPGGAGNFLELWLHLLRA